LLGKNLGYKFVDGKQSGSGGEVTVHQLCNLPSDDDYPNLIIMSDPDAVLDIGDAGETLVTALVRAPQMTFKQGKGFRPGDTGEGGATAKYIEGNGSVVYYGKEATNKTYDSENHEMSLRTRTSTDPVGDAKVNKTKLTSIALIGQLIAGDIQIPNDANWGMLFVEIPSTPVPPTPPTPGSTNPFAGESTVLFYDYY